MKILTICFGILLTLLGGVYYYLTNLAGDASYFPALAGVFITLFGILQGRWKHKNPLYGSLLLSFLVLLGWLINLIRVLMGNRPADNVFVVRSVIGVAALVFIGLGLVLIKNFWPGWKAFGQFLGNWLARVVLTIFYFTILIPFGLGVRFFADPLHIKKQPAELWRPRTTGDQNLEDVVRQF